MLYNIFVIQFSYNSTRVKKNYPYFCDNMELSVARVLMKMMKYVWAFEVLNFCFLKNQNCAPHFFIQRQGFFIRLIGFIRLTGILTWHIFILWERFTNLHARNGWLMLIIDKKDAGWFNWFFIIICCHSAGIFSIQVQLLRQENHYREWKAWAQIRKETFRFRYIKLVWLDL